MSVVTINKMRKVRLSELIKSLGKKQHIIKLALLGNPDPIISSVVYDSRNASKNCIFFAIEGLHTDGHRYIGEAIKHGAVAIVHSKELTRYSSYVNYIQVPNPREALSKIANQFYGKPSEKITVIGVTGTDGKSSTVWFIYQMLSHIGIKAGFMSTVNFLTDREVTKNNLRQSTPEAPEIQELLSMMVENGKEYAIVEATSHGLSNKTLRLADVKFNTAVLTNVTHEHLEFHGTLEQYRSDKANLFRRATETGIINLDDPNSKYFENAFLNEHKPYDKRITKHHERRCFFYATKPENFKNSSVYAYNIQSNLKETRFSIVYTNGKKKLEREIKISLPGAFNVNNILASLLAAIKTCKLTTQEIEDILSFLPQIKGVPGRMEHITMGQPFDVIVDYAHTPESFSEVLPFIKKYTKGKLITLFGSAGERDVEKRPQQGKIAATYSDVIVITDEDPRAEDSMKIINEIAAGALSIKKNENLILEPNREAAIKKAFSIAEPGDTVVLLGKGHENSIIYDGYSIYWDEKEFAQKTLKEMGYGK